MRSYQTAARHIIRLRFSPDGTKLTVVGTDLPSDKWYPPNGVPFSAAFLLGLADGQELRRVSLPPRTYALCPHSGRVASVVFDVIFDEAGYEDVDFEKWRIEIRDPWEDKVHGSYRPDAVPVTHAGAFLFTPDGKRVVSSEGYAIELGNGRWSEAIHDATDWVWPSPCSRYLASGHHLARVTVWSGGSKVKEYPIVANDMAWSSADWLAWLHGLDLYFGAFDRAALGPGGRVDSTGKHPILVFHPAGHTLFTGGADGRVQVWDPRTCRPLREYRWRVGAITAIAFSADGLLAAAGGESGQVVVWDADG